MKPTPYQRSYWVVPDKLLAGAYPAGKTSESSAAKIQALLNVGVTDIINLMYATETNHDGVPFYDYLSHAKLTAATRGRSVEGRRYSIVDGSTTTPDAVKAILDDIDVTLNRGGVVYVHCWGGRGRTGTVVCCWLVRHGLATPMQAVAHMNALIGDKIEDFRPTPENDKQRLFIEAWQLGQ